MALAVWRMCRMVFNEFKAPTKLVLRQAFFFGSERSKPRLKKIRFSAIFAITQPIFRETQVKFGQIGGHQVIRT